MKQVSRQRRSVTPAQRGQIIQRVLVDGWTAKQAAVAAGVTERAVAAWVAAYRRDGMASLRYDPSNASAVALSIWRPIASWLRAFADLLRGPSGQSAKVAQGPLPRDDRRHGV